MTLGQSNSEAAKQHVTPNIFKSDAEKAKENVEQGVRHATGSTVGHDHNALGQDTRGITSALKPRSESSVGDQVKQKIENPTGESSTEQARDYVTPGDNSASSEGVLERIKKSVTGHSNEHA